MLLFPLLSFIFPYSVVPQPPSLPLIPLPSHITSFTCPLLLSLHPHFYDPLLLPLFSFPQPPPPVHQNGIVREQSGLGEMEGHSFLQTMPGNRSLQGMRRGIYFLTLLGWLSRVRFSQGLKVAEPGAIACYSVRPHQPVRPQQPFRPHSYFYTL